MPATKAQESRSQKAIRIEDKYGAHNYHPLPVVLEKGEQSSAVTRLADDLPLFAAAPARPASGAGKTKESEVEKALAAINPDELTPREALEALYALRQRLSES